MLIFIENAGYDQCDEDFYTKEQIKAAKALASAIKKCNKAGLDINVRQESVHLHKTELMEVIGRENIEISGPDHDIIPHISLTPTLYDCGSDEPLCAPARILADAIEELS